MAANLDAQIKISGLKALSGRDADVKNNYDDMFLKLYEDIISEAEVIKKKPIKYEVKESVKKKASNKKKILLVESILSESDETFVRNLYIKVLGREPDKAGYENHLTKLKNNKNADREQIIYNFWKSDEGQKRNLELIGFHKVYMDELLGHNEMDFVEHAFLQILGRKPDNFDAKNYYDAIYKQGKSKEEMIRIIKESDECKKRKVEIAGFEKALKRRQFKENVLAKPVIGNAVLAAWNILHINRRLTEINENIAKVGKQSEDRCQNLDEKINKNTARIDRLNNPEPDTEYLERLNRLLSVRKTLWGSEERLHISERASVSTCFFNTNSGDITIGDYTFAGSNVSILAGSHDKNLKGLPRRNADETEGFDINIGSGVWLGSNCVILGPATIGDNAVIAAGAVVVPGTKVPANAIYGGIPAKQIGEELSFDDDYSKSLLKALDRRRGVLFIDGWSEETTFKYKNSDTIGYYLLDETGKVLLKAGTYSLKYSFDDNKEAVLGIYDGEKKSEFELKENEGVIRFEIKPRKASESENDAQKSADQNTVENADRLNCRYVTISVQSEGNSLKNYGFAIRIES